MEMRAGAREEARADLAEQQDNFKHKREQALLKQFDKLVAEYLKVVTAYDQYQNRAVETLAAARAKLAKIKSASEQHKILREQIEMRVLGLGLVEHAVSWSSGGRLRWNGELLATLDKVLKAEAQLRADGALPTEA
eukprot:3980016-Pleurochrysis_carterae.AAC.1